MLNRLKAVALIRNQNPKPIRVSDFLHILYFFSYIENIYGVIDMQDRRASKLTIYTYGAILFGFCLGCILCWVMYVHGNGNLLSLGLEDYDISAVLNVPNDKLFFILLKKRIIQMLIFFLFAMLTSYYVTVFCFCSGFGVYYSLVLCDLIIQYGLSGLGYGVVCFFPHYIFYFFAIFFLGRLYEQSKIYKYTVKKGILFFKIFVIFLFVVIAFFWESQFQKNFLKYFFQYLV